MVRHSLAWSIQCSIFLFVWLFQQVPAQSTVTFYPQAVPRSGAELINPLRGYYDRGEIDAVPLPEISLDSYQRYYWFDPDNPELSLEMVRGEYNFTQIDTDIAEADSKGEKFALRVRAMGTENTGKRYVPDYLSDCGWSYRDTFIPDWNGACFLDSAANLLQALGARYDNDPRIAWIDIGMYGRSGSWALVDSIYASAPDEISPASSDSLKRIVQMHLDAFPHARKVMVAKTYSAAVIHALSSSDQVGWRADCLGRDGYFDFATNERYTAVWSYLKDRWKTAPVIAEFCSGFVDTTYTTALRQVRDFHVSAIGNGGIGSWRTKTARQQDNLLQVGKISGYRFQIKDITVPELWTPGAVISISTNWENVGVAPNYEQTIVFFQLYDRYRRRYVWAAPSAVNLQVLLPTGGAPYNVFESFTLPKDLPPGRYEVRVKVIDPLSFRRPLRLAMEGERSDGSYRLGDISAGQ